MLVRIHKEGKMLIAVLTLAIMAIAAAVYLLWPGAFWPVYIALLLIWVTFAQFFRNPVRQVVATDNHIIYAPADGKICVIEEVFEKEYFKDKRLQVSIFMSPTNVHVNRNPVSGTVNYFKYHPGKYLVAWHPKSSEENERTTIVYGLDNAEILMRQIAGALAKRIRTYVQVGDQVAQGDDMGFIKFGSRVDLYLPLNAKIEVEMNQKVKGNQTVIARLA
jgi:phosphatidylserine decarboxylase